MRVFRKPHTWHFIGLFFSRSFHFISFSLPLLSPVLFMDSMNGTVLPPWESAVKAASGDLGYYPLSHCEGELQ